MKEKRKTYRDGKEFSGIVTSIETVTTGTRIALRASEYERHFPYT
jgi:hypothetical protein